MTGYLVKAPHQAHVVVCQDEETQVMKALAWATVGDMEPKLHKQEQAIEFGLPGKLQKIKGCLEPARQRVEELEKLYQDQVSVSFQQSCVQLLRA